MIFAHSRIGSGAIIESLPVEPEFFHSFDPAAGVIPSIRPKQSVPPPPPESAGNSKAADGHLWGAVAPGNVLPPAAHQDRLADTFDGYALGIPLACQQFVRPRERVAYTGALCKNVADLVEIRVQFRIVFSKRFPLIRPVVVRDFDSPPRPGDCVETSSGRPRLFRVSQVARIVPRALLSARARSTGWSQSNRCRCARSGAAKHRA